jgi:hypothetical protein
MTRFVESPVPCCLIGLAVLSILLILYLQTRRAAFMGAMLIVVLLVVAGIFIEQVVVTDREAIETAVYDLAASVEANDLPAVLSHISPQATQARRAAEREMGRYEVELARVLGKLDIDISYSSDGNPYKAEVRFQGVVKAKEGRSQLEGGARLGFETTFVRERDRWLLSEVSWDER